MAILTGTLIDSVTYWTRSGINDEGNPTYNTPVTISARWVNTQTLIRDVNGEEISSDVVVYSDVELNIGDWVFDGTSVASTPPDPAFQIRQKFRRRSLSGDETIYRYFL